jgi:pimeloyl-ACP methyl ester carboxylesterase
VIFIELIRISVVFTGRGCSQYIEISGIKIRYNQIGKGQDILFIHGVPGSIEDWESVISSLSSFVLLSGFSVYKR